LPTSSPKDCNAHSYNRRIWFVDTTNHK
jgi:hypothetical protein